jgi:rare lipoprotein A
MMNRANLRGTAAGVAIAAGIASCTPPAPESAPKPAAATEPAAQAAGIDTADPNVQAAARDLARQPPVPPVPGHRIAEDSTGRKQSGKVSVYGSEFQGRKMANGRPLDHQGNAAASKTLPLGTVAKVTNLDNGRTAVVTVQDHGPYVDGRSLDVTKSTAERLGLGGGTGVAPVVVAPVAVPQSDGSVKPGAGALPGPATAQ